MNGCRASRDHPFGERCGDPATHWSQLGPRCTKHAEELRAALRNPNAIINLSVGRGRSEKEIERFVKELQ